MNIDLAALRALAQRTGDPGRNDSGRHRDSAADRVPADRRSAPRARVEIDRKTGEATVFARSGTTRAARTRVGRHPADFGRMAAMTARQVILQRLRDAHRRGHYGEYAGREATWSPAWSRQAHGQPAKGIVMVDLGKLEAMLPAAEQVPGEPYEHGTGSSFVRVRRKGFVGRR